MARVLDLEVELLRVTPRVWRRVRVPADFTLGDLHQVIQVVMGWHDHHLHLFEVAGREYGQPPDDDWEREQWDGTDESTLKLIRAFAESAGVITYVYDFGNDWRVNVQLSADTIVAGPRAVECTQGEMNGPLEGTGGATAYQEILDVWMRQGRSGLSSDLRDRLPARFDPVTFDRAAVNERLAAATVEDRAAHPPAPAFADAAEQLVADVTLLALFLGSWEEPSGRLTAWKTVRFEVLDVLKREGLIDTTPARKSVVMTEAGARRAAELRKRLGAALKG